MSWYPIDPRARQLSFSNGHVAHYDALISSVPLPDLVRMIHGAPHDVLEAVAAPGLLDLCGRERRREPRGPFPRPRDLLLRRGYLFYAPRFSAHARREQRFRRDGKHPGGSLLLRQVQALYRLAR